MPCTAHPDLLCLVGLCLAVPLIDTTYPYLITYTYNYMLARHRRRGPGLGCGSILRGAAPRCGAAAAARGPAARRPPGRRWQEPGYRLLFLLPRVPHAQPPPAPPLSARGEWRPGASQRRRGVNIDPLPSFPLFDASYAALNVSIF